MAIPKHRLVLKDAFDPNYQMAIEENAVGEVLITVSMPEEDTYMVFEMKDEDKAVFKGFVAEIKE